MGTCPECKFDGSQDLPLDLKYPDGCCSEPVLEIDDKGKMVKDSKGKPKWGTRERCPACGFTSNQKDSVKPKVKKEVEV